MHVAANTVTPVESLYRRAWHNPDGTAFMAGNDRWDYARVAAKVKRLACGLSWHGVKEGDRVVLQLPDGPEFIITMYACFHVGAIAAPLTNHVDAIALKRLMTIVQPVLYIGDASLAGSWDAIVPGIKRFVVGEATGVDRAGSGISSWESLLRDDCDPPPIAGDIHSEAVMFAKPERIGEPNYVVHSHATLSALFALPFMCGCR